MRIYLDVAEKAGELFIRVSGPDGSPRAERPVAYAGPPARRLLMAKDAASAVTDPAALVTAIDQGEASADDLALYGGLLFEAAFGQQLWQQLLAEATGRPYLELAIRRPSPGSSGSQREAADWHSLRWEALHDGTQPVAARGATCAATGATVPVGVVRLVEGTTGSHVPFGPIENVPRVLFAVGSRLTDPNVRPGAEFMGIMRHMEDHGLIHPRVLTEATLDALRREIEAFRPQVLHLIGHGQRAGGQVKVQLRPEPSAAAGDEWVTAERLLRAFGEAERMPRMVILSACHTASAGVVNALPFAAQLVAGGVPVAVAMAGDIADTACRVFTRALTAAIGQGVPLAEAVIRGRRAAFYQRPDYASSHWIMPSVFLAEGVSGTSCLVDVARTKAVRDRISWLELTQDPVFYGRGEFIDALDRLLDGDDPLNVLLAYTPDPYKSYGGERLLRQLGARAVREGVLPILLAGLEKNPPTTREALAGAISDQLYVVRTTLSLPERDSQQRLVAAAGASRLQLVKAIRAELDALVADLPADDPVRARKAGRPRVILLCHRVDKWVEALDDLLAMLGTAGLHPGAIPVPVVLTGADIEPLKTTRLRDWNGRLWVKSAPLDRFPEVEDEDILAYLWWLLTPPDGTPAYAPKRDAPPGWQEMLRWAMKTQEYIYNPVVLFSWAEAAKVFLTSERDDDLLASYARVAT